jgi:Phytanoyl-CoA dioxygenase (PhyH)
MKNGGRSPHAVALGENRHVFTKRNVSYLRWRFLANAVPTMRYGLSAHVFSETRGLVKELRNSGILLAPSNELLSDFGQSMLTEAARKILAKANSPEVADVIEGGRGRVKNYFVDLGSESFEVASPLLQLALDAKVLDIVSAYLGMWPYLSNVYAWLNFPTTDPAKETQLWHRDPDDERCVKVFVYLVDVDEDKGPFTYIKGSQPLGPEAHKLPDRDIRVPDDLMRRIFPEKDWFACTGPAGTMIIADTIGYHRGAKPKLGNRVLMTFTYTSISSPCGRDFKVIGPPDDRMTAIQKFALRKGYLTKI